MKLSSAVFSQRTKWEQLGYHFPKYDVVAAKQAAWDQPCWLHLGAGNIFRAFPAACWQQLLNEGLAKQGILAAEGYDEEIVDLLQAADGLTINVTLQENRIDKEILGSVADYLKMIPGTADFQRLQQIIAAPSLQMVTLTITEKGYGLTDSQGAFLPAVEKDLNAGPRRPVSYLGKLASLLLTRFSNGQLPLALVSLDNMSRNGEQLQQAVWTYAEHWQRQGQVPAGFLDYVKDPAQISFPWTMIDKITPRPDQKIAAAIAADGFAEMAPKVTKQQTFVAPFVNGEATQYLFIEEAFPNGRPPLEQAGIGFVSRQVVQQVETMKVTACLNPLHTALAIFGCLLGYQRIDEELRDADLLALIKRLGYQEGLPAVAAPDVIDPKVFLDEVITMRLPNPFIPDTPQRIATDTSQKLAIRFGETVKTYLADEKLSVAELKVIPLVYAGWLRYLTGINDAGQPFELSGDPLLPDLQPLFAEVNLGDKLAEPKLTDLLKNKKIFGVDLTAAGLATDVFRLLNEMLAGPGAVRQTIQETLKLAETVADRKE